VAFSIERFLVVYFPLSRYKINTRNKAILIATLAALAFTIYVYTLLDISAARGSSKRRDEAFEKHIASLNILITILIPFVIICTINFLISYKLIKGRRDKHLLQSGRSASHLPTMMAVNLSSRNSRYDLEEIGLRGERNLTELALLKRERTYFRTARQLLLILTTFLVLNTPLVYTNLRWMFFNYAALAKIDNMAEQLTTNSSLTFENATDQSLRLLQELNANALPHSPWVVDLEMFIAFIAEPVYYLNFSINFFLYAFDRRKLKPEILFGCAVARLRTRRSNIPHSV
jgi:hypothetical protein